MAVLLKKISGSTLVETLVAMTIITLVTGFSMVIFLAVYAPGSSIGPLLKAQQISAEIMDTINTEQLQINPSAYSLVQKENLWFEKSISQRDQELFEVVVEVRDNNDKPIYTRKRLMYAAAP